MADTRRPWLVALLAVFYPGLGHAYLREWLRALLWFVLAVATTILVVPSQAFDVTSLSALFGAQSELPLSATLALISVSAFSVIDAYLLAVREQADQTATEEGRCPHCGREVEPDLSFCHWCTKPLDAGVADE